jgi:hypothetical protein
MAAFAAQQELALRLVERRAPLDELANVPGRFADHHFHDFAIA